VKGGCFAEAPWSGRYDVIYYYDVSRGSFHFVRNRSGKEGLLMVGDVAFKDSSLKMAPEGMIIAIDLDSPKGSYRLIKVSEGELALNINSRRKKFSLDEVLKRCRDND